MVDRHDTLLLVEDDVHIRLTMGAILRDEGYDVVEASNGQEALTQLASGLRPCLILLDIMMPIMNGWEFREVQHRDPALSSIPVLVVSADRSVRERILKTGVVDFLPKPVDLDRLLTLVTQSCPGERPSLTN